MTSLLLDLHDSNAHFAALAEKKDPHILLDQAGEVIWMNQAANAEFSITSGMCIDQLFTFPGDESPEIKWQNYAECKNGDHLLALSIQQKGNGKWYELSTELTTDDSEIKFTLLRCVHLKALSGALNKLFKRAEFFQNIMDQIPVDIVVLDTDLKYRFFNKHAIKDQAFRQWMIGKTDFDFVENRGLEISIASKRMEIFKEVIASKENFSFDEMIRKGDKQNWNLRLLTPFLDEHGNVEMLVGYGLNTTLFHEFKRKVELQALAISASGEGIAMIDNNGDIVFSNDVFQLFVGKQQQSDCIGISFATIMQPYLDNLLMSEVQSCMEVSGEWIGELFFDNGSGKRVGEVKLIRITEGREICYIRDITERKLKQAEISKLATVASRTSSIVFITNAEAKIEWVNDAFTKVTGYRPADAIGKSPGALLNGPDTDRKVIERMEECIREKINFEGEIQNYKKDGTPLWLLVSSTPIFDANGELLNFVNVESDITLIKQTEANALSLLEKEKELSQIKSRFVNLTSHEFRTPLTSILSNVELLRLMRSKGIQGEKVDKALTRIMEEVDRMTELMDNFLHLGRYNAGQTSFRPAPQDILEFLSQQIRVVEERHTGLQIAVTIIGEPVLIDFDVTLMGHVLQNLIGNAVKYSVGCKDPMVEVEFRDLFVQLSVIDFGIGVPKKDIGRLFTSFYRAKNTDNIQGTGLGLVVVKHFVELHQGQIYVQSEEHKGATFIIRLPIKKHGKG